MITSQDGETRATRILMPNKNILQRSIVHLYPLECHDEEPNKESNDDASIEEKTIDNTVQDEVIDQDAASGKRTVNNRPRRKAAQEARDKIFGQNILND